MTCVQAEQLRLERQVWFNVVTCVQDRVAREAEQLRLERQRLAAEKEEQRRKWNLDAQPGHGVVSAAGTAAERSSGRAAPTINTTAYNGAASYGYGRLGNHSPPEKLQPDTSIGKSSTLPSRLSSSKQRVFSVDRKEETLVARSPYGSSSSLSDTLRRATPAGARKSFPIQPKPNIKSELLNAPLASSPSASLRVSLHTELLGRQGH